MVTDEVFRCISDPTRRRIIELLARRPRSVSTIVAHFEVSRPAVSRHLRRLREADLVVEIRAGRERIHRLDEDALTVVETWLDFVASGGAVDLDDLDEREAVTPGVPESDEDEEMTPEQAGGVGDWRQW